MSWMRRRSIRPAAARALAVGVLAAGIAAPASANAGVLDSVAGWWPMYEGSGQVVHDLSGHGNNGMLGTTPGVDANDPTWIRGFLFGSGLRFDGNDVVRIPDGSSLEHDDGHRLGVGARVAVPGQFKYVLGKGATSQCRSSDYGLYTAAGGGLALLQLGRRPDGHVPHVRRGRARADLGRQVALRRRHVRRHDRRSCSSTAGSIAGGGDDPGRHARRRRSPATSASATTSATATCSTRATSTRSPCSTRRCRSTGTGRR